MEMDAVHGARRRFDAPAATLHDLASPLFPRTLRRHRGVDGHRMMIGTAGTLNQLPQQRWCHWTSGDPHAVRPQGVLDGGNYGRGCRDGTDLARTLGAERIKWGGSLLVLRF